MGLYCSPEKEVELRQLLDPANMARLVDFCKSYDLEIFYDTLYICQAEGARDAGDQTTMVKDLEDFIKNNDTTLRRF